MPDPPRVIWHIARRSLGSSQVHEGGQPLVHLEKWRSAACGNRLAWGLEYRWTGGRSSLARPDRSASLPKEEAMIRLIAIGILLAGVLGYLLRDAMSQVLRVEEATSVKGRSYGPKERREPHALPQSEAKRDGGQGDAVCSRRR